MSQGVLEPLKNIADLSNEWLGAALGAPVKRLSAKRIGTGQVSFCYRVAVEYDDASQQQGPQTVVVKIVSDDPNSRGAGLSLGIYEKETKFYNEVAPFVASGAMAKCYYSKFQDGNFTIVMEDQRDASVGDELVGATAAQARRAVVELARIHAQLASWDFREAKAPWLNVARPIGREMYGGLYRKFLSVFGHRVTDEQREICDSVLGSWDGFRAAQDKLPTGLVHGDFRLDNLLFGTKDALTIVDWQTVGSGPFMADLAYFMGSSLHTKDRRELQDELIKLYHDALGENPPVTLAECHQGVKYQSFGGVLMVVVSSMLVERTARGDEMFMAMFERHCAHVRDLDALSILIPDESPDGPPAWILPEEDDEGTHPPGIEYLWNESWYFDVVDAKQGIACYVRMGMNPNQNSTWYMAIVSGPNIPTTAVLDYEAPLPSQDLVLQTDTLQATQKIISPLAEYKVTLDATGKQYTDNSLIRAKDTSAPDVPVKLDLTWKTVCKPYKWRLTTRYEIPCQVSGSIRCGNQNYSIEECPGQRDHSWGVRDWWGLDWMWSALHLSDGSHIHAVNLRFTTMEAMNLGYVQNEGQGTSDEIDEVETEKVMTTEDGLLGSSKMAVSSAGKKFVMNIEPVAHGALVLEATDGRVSKFARAWVNLTLPDGKTGVGWIEFNDAASSMAGKS